MKTLRIHGVRIKCLQYVNYTTDSNPSVHSHCSQDNYDHIHRVEKTPTHMKAQGHQRTKATSNRKQKAGGFTHRLQQTRRLVGLRFRTIHLLPTSSYPVTKITQQGKGCLRNGAGKIKYPTKRNAWDTPTAQL